MKEVIIGLVHSTVVFGIGFMVIGLVFLLAPHSVMRFNEWGKKQVFTEAGVVKCPRLTGCFFLAVAAFLFIIYRWLR